MNIDWQDFLLTRGAVLDTNGSISFPESDGQAFEAAQTYACNLGHLGLIRASGEETFQFLHGQFTNDLNQVDVNTSQLSSYCNAKGRMLAILRVFKRDEDYFLLMRRDVIASVLKKLNMFKLMAKVELTDVSDEFVVFGIVDPKNDALLKEMNIQVPKELDQVITQHGTTLIKLTGESSRTLIIAEPEKAKEIWQSAAKQSIQSSDRIWELVDIQNGIPDVTAETSEAFIPQMVNLELIGGVNFQKGCYPGQEIVARTHYLGKPNRRMYRINIESGECPSAGNNIYSQADGEQPVGKIVNAQKTNKNNCEALAVLRTEKESSNDLHLESLSGPVINLTELPYCLNTD